MTFTIQNIQPLLNSLPKSIKNRHLTQQPKRPLFAIYHCVGRYLLRSLSKLLYFNSSRPVRDTVLHSGVDPRPPTPTPPTTHRLTTLVSDHLRAHATSLFSLYHLVVQRQSLPSSTFQLVRVRAALVGIPLSYEDLLFHLLFVFLGSFHSSGGISSPGKTCLSSRVRLSDFARYYMTIRFVFVPCFFERMKRVVFVLFGKSCTFTIFIFDRWKYFYLLFYI